MISISLQSELVKSMTYYSEEMQVFVCENTNWGMFGTLVPQRMVASPIPHMWTLFSTLVQGHAWRVQIITSRGRRSHIFNCYNGISLLLAVWL